MLYLVGPHEAYEENNRKSNDKDVDTQKPGTPLHRQYEALYHAKLK